MRDTTLLQFKVKNTALAAVMQMLPVRTTADEQENYSFTPFQKGQPWYSEECLHLDVPRGGSIAQWFLNLMRDPNKRLASLYRYEDTKERVAQGIEAKGIAYCDERTISAEIEICNICCESGEDCSSYAYEKRIDSEITIIQLSAEQWRQDPAHEPFAEALAGDLARVRKYAKKLDNIQVISCVPEKEEQIVTETIAGEENPYNATLAKAEDWSYQAVKKGKIQLIEYTGVDEIVYIPEVIDGQIVIELGGDLFKDKRFIKKIIMPDTVEVLKANAFRGIGVQLKHVHLSQNLKEIGMQAFDGISVPTLDIPASVTQIKGGALASFSLETVIIRGEPKISTNLKVFGWYPKMVVHAPAGGAVHAYCKKQGVRFVAL